jgi:DNA-binding NarL/FixJ family response regulator
MGLYIVSGILASLGTTLEIDSAPGRGSCFRVVFPGPAGPLAGNTTPKKDADPVGSPEKSDADLRSGGTYPFRIPPPEKPSATGEEAGKKTLLLVDDDTDMLVFLKDSLEGRFNLLFAQGPQELLENLADWPVPDLIVSDIMMDGMDGHELYEQLQRGNWRSVPLIFLSARGESDELLKSFRQGAVDFIAKPFRLPDLVARIESRHSGQERQRQMLLESVQQRISESLQPLRSSGGEKQERLNRREQVYRRLSLSPREEEILDRMVRGHTSKEIADHLGISVRTVEKHISNLYRKAGVQNRVELVNLVLDPGFREGGEST